MTRSRLGGPATLAVTGSLLFGSWLVGGLPLLSLPLPYPPGTEWRRVVVLILFPLVSSSLLLTGGIVGTRRRRAAGRRGASLVAIAFGLAAAAGAVAVAFALYVAAGTLL